MKVLIDQWNGDRVAAKWIDEKWVPESGYEDQKFKWQQYSPEHYLPNNEPKPRWREQDVGSEGPGELAKSSSTPMEGKDG